MPWRLQLAGWSLALLGAFSSSAPAANCSFAKRPPVTLNQNQSPFGFCKFDLDSLSYAGTPAEQAGCLLRPVQVAGRLGKPRETMPEFFVRHVGGTGDLPDKEKLAALLKENGLHEMAASLAKPVSRGRDNDPAARPATYFVIHDTSTPNYGALPWPPNIDTDPKINNLARYSCDNDIERAHIFINRMGAVLFAHDFEVPWRATKFETAVNFGLALRGLYLHVELIQPRRRHPEFRGKNDFLAPDPGFSPAQYDALALVYAAASLRAGFWMIPAFHSVIDEGIRDKHDDPQNFRLEDLNTSLEKLLGLLKQNP